jgi:hypothetical protein
LPVAEIFQRPSARRNNPSIYSPHDVRCIAVGRPRLESVFTMARTLTTCESDVQHFGRNFGRESLFLKEIGYFIRRSIPRGSNAVVPTSIERVTEGGSFLCNVNYCERYRPTAGRGTPPEHIGFRCVMSADAAKQSNRQ